MPTAQAVLFDRGGGLIYDDVFDITWLQDANLCATNPANPACVAANANANGSMNFANANIFANNLVFGGFDNWRLPITNQPDPTCSGQIVFTPPQGFFFNCTGSEMGHLFNVDGITASAPGLFSNIQTLQFDRYWSSTVFELNPGSTIIFRFDFSSGFQGAGSNALLNFFAWAVRPGDVVASVPEPSPVPEPSILLLIGTGSVGFLSFSQRKRRL